MLAKLSELKNHIGVTNTAEDDVLASILQSVSTFIASRLRRVIEKQTGRIEYHDGGEEIIMLDAYPVTTVTTVHRNDGTAGTPVWTLVDADEYVVYSDEGYIRTESGVFEDGRRNYKVTYTGGYAAADIPADIRLLALELASAEYKRRRAHGVKSETLGSARIDWSDSLTDMQNAVLDTYRKPLI